MAKGNLQAERTSSAKVEALVSRIEMLECVCADAIADEQLRRTQCADKLELKKEWDRGLPARVRLFKSDFIGKRCVLNGGRSTFQAFLVKAYREFCRDSETTCREPTNHEIRTAQDAAYRAKKRWVEPPERPAPIAIDWPLVLTDEELRNAILSIEGVGEDVATNVHNVVVEVFTGIRLKPGFTYEHAEPTPTDVVLPAYVTV